MIPFDNIKYIGLFLNPIDQELILKEFPPIYEVITADHVTLFYKPRFNLDKLVIGKEYEILVTGQVINDNLGAQALYVEVPATIDSESKIPHLTISMKRNLPTIKNSQDIVDALTTGEIKTLKNPFKLKVKFGYFDNKSNQIVANL